MSCNIQSILTKSISFNSGFLVVLTLAYIYQFYAYNTQMFRVHFESHKRLSAFFLTKETPTHDRIAVQNICMRSTSRLGEICSEKRLLTNTSSALRPLGSKMLTPDWLT